MTSTTDRVAVIVDDMFFTAKINGAAAERGVLIERVKTQEQLDALVTNPPTLVIIDLNADRMDPVATIKFFKSHAELKPVPIVSFVSHVQTELIRGAQAAGCDYVLPRSAFTQLLTQIVGGNLASIRARA